MLRLDELAPMLQLTVREDRAAKALAVSRGTSVRHPVARPGARVDRREDPRARAPPRCATASRWLVPPDAVSRALAPMAGDSRGCPQSVTADRPGRPAGAADYRSAGPRRDRRSGSSSRSSRGRRSPSCRSRGGCSCSSMPTASTSARSTQAAVSSSRSRPPTRLTLAIALSKDFGTFRAATVPIDAASSRLVIDLTAAGAPAPSGLARAQSRRPPHRRRRRPLPGARPETAAALPAAQTSGRAHHRDRSRARRRRAGHAGCGRHAREGPRARRGAAAEERARRPPRRPGAADA